MTINEIAKMAGVSRATVSRYLNEGYVSEEKKEKIRRVIEETGYKPSAQAQMLRTRKTKLIGVILPKIHSDSVSRMTAGISDVLTKRGYQILLANTGNSTQEELKYLALFKENQVDGVILIGTIFTSRHKKLLSDYRVPIVILGQQLEGYSCVYQDDFNAARELTEVLLEKCRHVGYIGVTQSDTSAGLSRKKGYEEALRKKQRPLRAELCEEAEFTLDSGYWAADRLLARGEELDGIFCATDTIAVGAMTRIKELGRKIPEDISLVGTGDTLLGRVVEPRLTTVHFYYKTSGMEAASMLVDMLESKSYTRKELKMGYEVIRKESTRG